MGTSLQQGDGNQLASGLKESAPLPTSVLASMQPQVRPPLDEQPLCCHFAGGQIRIGSEHLQTQMQMQMQAQSKHPTSTSSMRQHARIVLAYVSKWKLAGLLPLA